MSTDVVSFGISRQRALKDQLSPYKIAVLILIEDHCRVDLHSNLANVCSYSDVEELTFLTTLLQLLQVVSHTKSAVQQFRVMVFDMPDRTLFQSVIFMHFNM